MPPNRSRLRRWLTRAVPTFVGVTVAVSGLAAPAPEVDPDPVLESRTQTLTDGVARPGFRRTVRTPMPTQLVGFTWEGSPHAEIEVRSLVGDRWSDWSELHTDGDEGPDADSDEYSERRTAGPVWVGRRVRDVEVRVAEGRLEGLRLHAIRSENGMARGPLKAAAADAPQPGIISRAQWGADESLRSTGSGCTGQPDYASRVRYSVVHHTAHASDSNSYGPGDSASIVRGIYQFHTQTNGWCDIGYNFVIDRYGQIFEGRFGGIDRPVIGAHAAGFNTESTGVAVLGEFTSSSLPPEGYGALKSLLAWKLSIHDVNPNGQVTVTAGAGSSKYSPGSNVTIHTISGHRDVGSTSCPGNQLYNILPQLRPDVASAALGSSWRPAIVRRGVWYLRNTQTSGAATTVYAYGDPGDVPLYCDWDGNGSRTPGVFRRGLFYLRNDNSPGVAHTVVGFGDPTDVPVCGDWDGNGTDTVGVKRGFSWYLRNSNTTGVHDVFFLYGDNGDRPVAGDWDGNGTDTVGVIRGTSWFLADNNVAPVALFSFGYGDPGDVPLVGDWDGNGTVTPGIVRRGIWHLTDTIPSAVSNVSFAYGDIGDTPRA
jgi:hypothetical protein